MTFNKKLNLKILDHIFIILIFAAFFLATRSNFLFSTSLEMDELYTWFAVTKNTSDFFSFIIHDTQQFLYYIILKVIYVINPVAQDITFRYVTGFFAVLAIYVFYLILREKFENYIALIGALLLALHSNFYHISVYARPYSLLLFFVLLNQLSFMKLDNKALFKYLFHISLFMALYTHYLAAIYFLAFLVAAFLKERKKLQELISKKVLLTYFLFGIFYAGQFIYQSKHSSQNISWIKNGSLFSNIDYLNISSPFIHIAEGINFSIVVTVGVLLFLVVTGLCNLKRSTNLFFWLLFIFFNILMVLIDYFVKPILVDRYFSLIIPCMLFILIDLIYLSIGHKMKSMESVLLILPMLFLLSLSQKNYDYRGFLRQGFKMLKSTQLVPAKKIVCLTDTTPYEGEIIFSNYSKQFFGEDVCLDKLTWRNGGDIPNWADILFYYSPTDNVKPGDVEGYKTIFKEINTGIYIREDLNE